jgi:hypothetical protein
MDYQRILCGKEKELDLFSLIIPCLEDVRILPDMIEPVYRAASALDEETLDRFRFSLIRLQIYADIHRNEDLERAQTIKYTAQVIEKIVFGSLMMEHEDLSHE